MSAFPRSVKDRQLSAVDISFYRSVQFFFFFFFFLSFIYFTSFGEKDKADINSLRWSAPVGLEPAYTRM